MWKKLLENNFKTGQLNHWQILRVRVCKAFKHFKIFEGKYVCMSSKTNFTNQKKNLQNLYRFFWQSVPDPTRSGYGSTVLHRVRGYSRNTGRLMTTDSGFPILLSQQALWQVVSSLHVPVATYYFYKRNAELNQHSLSLCLSFVMVLT